MTKTIVNRIERNNGVAGQLSYTAHIARRDEAGEWSHDRVTLVGSEYGTPGPILVVTSSGMSVRVEESWRYGDRLNPGFVRRFLSR